MKKSVAVYLRVSTTGKDVKSQEPDLRAWLRAHGRGRSVLWYHDRFAGGTLERPGMRKLEDDIREGRVEALVVWRLDRLGRTAGQTIKFLDGLGDAFGSCPCGMGWTRARLLADSCGQSSSASPSTSMR